MRIYEIAKELGVSSKEVVSFLKEAGVECSSHMTVLTEDSLKKIKSHFSNHEKTTKTESVVCSDVRKDVGGTAGQHVPVVETSKPDKAAVEPKKPIVEHKVKQEPFVEDFKSSDPVRDEKTKHFPKKSDYVAEPVVPEEEVILSEEILGQTRLGRFLGTKFDGERIKSYRSGGRKRKKQKRAASNNEVQELKDVSEIKVSGDIPLFEVATMMGKSSGDVILALFKKGIACNRNHVLSLDNIRYLCELFNINLIVDKVQKTSENVVRQRSVSGSVTPRWPVVVVMGHVDHGKTTLLDYVRKMNVAASEAGGITQHLGAYEVDSKHGKLIFIDTPGHEAFYNMRERGAKVTDLVILVIAVDDGIKPQTIEAIDHAKTAGVPIVVAVNKIDKMQSSAALETIRRQLAQYGLMPEEWGGDVVVVPISAKTGQGVDELLDMVVLQSQLMDLKADPTVPAKAFVLESKVEKGLGPVATVICSEGTLKLGDFFTCGTGVGRVRLLINSLGKRISQAGPSIPVQVVGFDSFAMSGDILTVVSKIEYLKAKQDKSELIKKNDAVLHQIQPQQFEEKGENRVLNLIIKADTRGSIDAINGSIQKLSKLSKEVNYPVRIVLSNVGDISEGDVELAEHTNALLIGFYVKPEKNAANLARDKGIEIKVYQVIYHLIEDLEKIIESKRKIETVWKQCGEATVKKVFDIKNVGVIAGCYMRDGVLSRGNKVSCMRSGKEVGSGMVQSLQRDKKTVKEVHAGYECGFTCEGFNEWQEGDTVLCFSEVKQNPVSR